MYDHKVIRIATDKKAEETLTEFREMGYTLEGWKTYFDKTVQQHIFIFERYSVPDTTIRDAVREHLAKTEVGGND